MEPTRRTAIEWQYRQFDAVFLCPCGERVHLTEEDSERPCPCGRRWVLWFQPLDATKTVY